MFANHLFRTLLRTFVAVFWVLSAMSTLAAQNFNGRISVTATGEAVAIPDQLEIMVNLNAKGKTFAEAAETFEEKREQLSNALNPMDFPDLEIESLGKKIANSEAQNDMVMVFEPGGPAAPKDVSYTAKELLRIVVRASGDDFAEGIELLTRVEEQVAKCGGTIGKPAVQYMPFSNSDSLVFASLSDRTKVTEKAWADAISKARTKAAKLAKLSQLQLRRIVSVKELSASDEDSQTQFYAAVAGLDDGRSGAVGEIKVKATLIIEFSAE